MADHIAPLRAARSVAWPRPARAPAEASTERVYIGADPNALALEVAVVSWDANSTPTLAALKRLHGARLGRRAIPLVVLAHRADKQAWIFGPAVDAPPIGPLATTYMMRLAQAALDEPTAGAARYRLMTAMEALLHADIPGLYSHGLFATHELTTGVPKRADWNSAAGAGKRILEGSPRGSDLVRALGFDSESIPGNAFLLRQSGQPAVALAILLREDESFERESVRFAKSPIYHGLELARQRNVRWLVIARGPELRLFPSSPDVGVGRRGATQTYFGLDLSLIDDAQAGYLPLVFGAAALAAGGSADEILAASLEHAVALERSLRERIYQRVVPNLAEAVARALATEGPLSVERLSLAYRMTLRVLFRLLFQAYAEDAGLLPLHQNERYGRASLKELAKDLAAHPDRPHDPRSTSLWDGLRQVWRVIDRGDAAWGVPAYDGGLFATEGPSAAEGAAIDRLGLPNDILGPALSGLLVDETDEGGRGPVDFRSLDVRDFGTIYEGLLEAGLSIADRDLALNAAGEFMPALTQQPAAVRAGHPYFHTKSGDRKATGSYFTPSFVVEHLIEHAVDPVVDAHLLRVRESLEGGDQVAAARMLFDLRIADLAMGSGHFLVAALAHLEQKFGAFLETNPIPGVERELIDLEAAAEQAMNEVALPALIDRSSLIGRQVAKRCLYGVDVNEIAVELARLAIWVRTFVPGLPMSSLDHQLVAGNSLTGLGTVEDAVISLDPYSASDNLSFTGSAIRQTLDEARQVLADAAALKEATAAESRAAAVGYQDALRAAEPARLLMDAALAVRLGLMRPPSDFDVEGLRRTLEAVAVTDELTPLKPVHFPVLFPEVFLRENPGFDAVVGNPPWDKIRHEPTQFWAVRAPGLLQEADRDSRISELRAERPDDALIEAEEKAIRERLRDYVAIAYSDQGSGHYDLAKVFAERNLRLVRHGGGLGLVLPGEFCLLPGWQALRRSYMASGRASVVQCQNQRGFLFENVHFQEIVALISLLTLGPESLSVTPGANSLPELRASAASPIEFAAGEVSELSPTAQIPWFGARSAAEVFSQICAAPRLGTGAAFIAGKADTRWDFSGSGRDAHAVSPDDARGSWRVLMTRHVDPYAIRASGFRRFIPENMLDTLSNRGVARSEARGFSLSPAHPRVVYRFPSSATNKRTLIAAWLPSSGFLYSTGYCHGIAVPPETTLIDYLALLAVVNSTPTDWWARRLVDRHVGAQIIRGLPVPAWAPAIRRRVAGLVASLLVQRGSSPREFVGVDLGSLTSEEDALAEIDALVAFGYGLPQSQIQVVFTTFHPSSDLSGRLQRVLEHTKRLSNQRQ